MKDIIEINGKKYKRIKEGGPGSGRPKGSKMSKSEKQRQKADDYAQDTIFEGRIAHGMLTAGLISAVIGEQLPGHGAIYMSQSLKFLAPVRPGDLVYAEVKVTDIQIDKRRVKLDCKCEVDGKNVLVGEAMVLAPSRKFD